MKKYLDDELVRVVTPYIRDARNHSAKAIKKLIESKVKGYDFELCPSQRIIMKKFTTDVYQNCKALGLHYNRDWVNRLVTLHENRIVTVNIKKGGEVMYRVEIIQMSLGGAGVDYRGFIKVTKLN